jgi:hypothetical protein
MIVRRDGEWLTAKIGAEVVMMSAERGNYLGLSRVCVRIWELIEARRNIGEVCAQLESEFEVSPEICREEVEAFLNELARHGAAVLEAA